MTSFNLNGVTVKLSRPGGSVMWMDDWSRCDELVSLGLLRREYPPNTFGHVDLYVVR